MPSVEVEEDEEYFYQVEQLTFLWVLFTLIVIGNSIVLITLSVSKAVIVKCEGEIGMILELHRRESSLQKAYP